MIIAGRQLAVFCAIHFSVVALLSHISDCNCDTIQQQNNHYDTIEKHYCESNAHILVLSYDKAPENAK